MWKQVIKFFGDENTKTLKSFQKQVDKINELEPVMQALKNEDFPVKALRKTGQVDDKVFPSPVAISAILP